MNHPLPRGWQEVKLGDIAEIIMGQSPQSEFYNKDKKGLPFLQGSSTFGYIYPTFDMYSSDIKKVAKDGSILMSVRAPVGDINIANTDICIGRGLCSINSSNKSINSYIFYILKYNKNKLLNNQKGTTFGAITKDDIINFNIILPPLDEQKRIADILSTFDDLIENLTKLIEKKELYKKGVMQRVLSGKVRFNGFTDEWEEVYIKDVGTIITGNTPSTKDKSFWGGKHVWVTPTDINKKDIDNSERKLTDIGLSKARKLPKNTLLVTCIASIGKNSILRCEGSCNQQINAIIPNKNFSEEFLYYIFENNKKYLNAKAPASATKIISKTEFEKLSFILPKIDEQKKIAELLTLIDKDIDNLKQLLHLRKLQKKGVMQKLLTGEVRV